MADKILKVGPQIRAMTVETCTVRKAEDGSKRFAMTLSSEYEVDRGWGFSEILSHDPSSIRLQRAKSGSMPLLFNHNADDPVGMVDKATVANKKLSVEGSFFTTQRAQDVAAMVEGGLRNVSVGYRIHKVENDVDDDAYTVTDWEPFEASIAPVPADPTVGMGRSAAFPEVEIPIAVRSARSPPDNPEPSNPTTEARHVRASSFLDSRISNTPEEGNSMSNETTGSTAGNSTQGAGAAAAGSDATRGANGNVHIEAPRGPSAQEIENARVIAIGNMCKACNMDEGLRNTWITSGASVAVVSEEVMRIVKSRADQNVTHNKAFLDLSTGDTQRFSIVKAIRATAEGGNWKGAEFEAECSREISQRMNKIPDSKRFFVPYDVQRRPIDPAAISSRQRALNLAGVAPYAQRADTVGVAGAGGYLVETTNVGFIELLRHRTVAYRLGATQLSGLVGNVNVPKQTGAGTAVWLGSETSTATEAEQAFGQMSLSPHTVAAYTEISRQLLLQSSPGVEGIVNADLSAVAALALDKGALSGSGTSGQPTGISNVAGVGVISGSAITALTYAGQLQYQVALANADVVPSRGAYVTTPTIAAFLMAKTRFPNTATPLWDGNLWDANGALGCAGFPGMSSNQVASQNVLFGDWSSLVIAEWGVLEIEVNPYAGFQAGLIGIRAMMTVDIGLRYPAAFATSSTTTS